ncbi:hypothetical protein NVP1121O_230 [Vibrio phage 1.121.O._10N.286.46.C4]|nr:hypothetical protein NVP1121O_230 [Vibrio phage 1.121.O._10N.286.46.C4]
MTQNGTQKWFRCYEDLDTCLANEWVFSLVGSQIIVLHEYVDEDWFPVGLYHLEGM